VQHKRTCWFYCHVTISSTVTNDLSEISQYHALQVTTSILCIHANIWQIVVVVMVVVVLHHKPEASKNGSWVRPPETSKFKKNSSVFHRLQTRLWPRSGFCKYVLLVL